MSMFNVAKFLHLSRSVDLSHDESRYFNISMVGAVNLHSGLAAQSRSTLLSPSCIREKNVERDAVQMREGA